MSHSLMFLVTVFLYLCLTFSSFSSGSLIPRRHRDHINQELPTPVATPSRPHPKYHFEGEKREFGINKLAAPIVDCPLKTFAATFAGYLQPSNWPHRSNWTAEAVSALQLPVNCNVSLEDIPTSPFTRESTIPTRALQPAPCQWQVYVDGTNGKDSNPGTMGSPFQTVVYAVTQSRARDPSLTTACISIRAGVYYFGGYQNAFGKKHESQIGAISLTSTDSGLTISSYNGEEVIFSAGTQLNLQWSLYKNTSAGPIMKATVPDGIALDWDHFNELYFDDWRGIRAKFPNGDPFLFGRHTSPSGYVSGAANWIGNDNTIPPAVEIHVEQPAPNSTYFPQFQIGVEGTVSKMDPPHSYWALKNPPGGGGSTYVITQGFKWNNNFSPRAANWSNPTTGRVFTFHCASWGSWQFAIKSLDAANQTIWFGDGGWQEGRGCSSGSDLYVHNIFEELDDVNEWFVDQPSRTLYFMPNKTMPTNFVASQVPCIISLHGDSSSPVTGVTISGIVFAHTPNNFLRRYETPSGGDYTINRGAAVVLEGSAFTSISGNSFYQLGGNAVVVSNWNLNATIIYNQFRFLGESGVILIGQSDGIDGVSNLNQPTYTHIESNLARDFSIYVKQGDAIFEALSRSSTWAGNLAFNAPRSIFNKNDGFAGGLDAYQNLLFNANRETGDHGPVNTWDRQPYLTEEGGNGPDLVPKTNQFHNNFLINDYGSDMSIDHDDGSAYYLDSYNFMMYSGTKNYLGHSKVNDHQVFAYSDVHPGYGFPGCQCDFTDHNWGSGWTNNKCILLAQYTPYSIGYCNPSDVSNIPIHANNQIYTPNGTAIFQCGNNKYTIDQWQRLGLDVGSSQNVLPDVNTVIGWGKQVLYLKNGYQVEEGSVDW